MTPTCKLPHIVLPLDGSLLHPQFISPPRDPATGEPQSPTNGSHDNIATPVPTASKQGPPQAPLRALIPAHQHGPGTGPLCLKDVSFANSPISELNRDPSDSWDLYSIPIAKRPSQMHRKRRRTNENGDEQ